MTDKSNGGSGPVSSRVEDYIADAGGFFHASTPITDFDTAYDNGLAVPEVDEYIAAWLEKAPAFRASWPDCQLDVPYGEGARNIYDYFLPTGTPKGTLVFIHGGYWRRFDKSYWSHLAGGALAQGWRVAIPSYTLAPAARVTDIVGEVAQAVNHICSGVEGPIVLAGHSAGGHLVSRLMCNDTALTDAVKARLQHVITLSGVHDLRPLLKLEINSDIRLDEQETNLQSPALLLPISGVKLSCIVGADELPEFIRQSGILANIWSGFGVDTGSWQVAGRHHFDIIDDLQSGDTALTLHILGLKSLV
ncbi:MAG: alpha/beta hydrolase [Candidatus Puniceispirillaceae bacterium]